MQQKSRVKVNGLGASNMRPKKSAVAQNPSSGSVTIMKSLDDIPDSYDDDGQDWAGMQQPRKSSYQSHSSYQGQQEEQQQQQQQQSSNRPALVYSTHNLQASYNKPTQAGDESESYNKSFRDLHSGAISSRRQTATSTASESDTNVGDQYYDNLRNMSRESKNSPVDQYNKPQSHYPVYSGVQERNYEGDSDDDDESEMEVVSSYHPGDHNGSSSSRSSCSSGSSSAGSNTYQHEQQPVMRKQSLQQQQRSVKPPLSKQAAPAHAPAPAPPLPCDNVNRIIKPEDKLFYSKERRPVEYKPYSGALARDYAEISKAAPDLNTEELQAKRANVQRIKDFSKNLQSFNRENLRQQPKLPPAAEKSEIVISMRKQDSKRERMLEFSKQIPKPQVRNPKPFGNNDIIYDEDDDDTFDPGMPPRRNRGQGDGGNYSTSADDYRLQELEAKHNNGKKQIDAIRKQMGL